MRKRIGAGLVLATMLGIVPPAYADHDYDDRRGDCRGTEGRCEDNDFSPSFQDSPVRDAFNFSPTICLPGSTCHVDRQPDEQQPRE